MKRVGWLVCVAALALTACARSEKVCLVCQRAECKGFAFRLTLPDGKRIETCCPRCGLHYLKVNHLEAQTLQATDLATGKWIDATKAIYLSGSDLSHCANMETRRDAYGCCFYKGYDRCQPSLLAFASRATAESFRHQHGGEIVGFAGLAMN